MAIGNHGLPTGSVPPWLDPSVAEEFDGEPPQCHPSPEKGPILPFDDAGYPQPISILQSSIHRPPPEKQIRLDVSRVGLSSDMSGNVLREAARICRK